MNAFSPESTNTYTRHTKKNLLEQTPISYPFQFVSESEQSNTTGDILFGKKTNNHKLLINARRKQKNK